jgi:hypothetical protein
LHIRPNLLVLGVGAGDKCRGLVVVGRGHSKRRVTVAVASATRVCERYTNRRRTRQVNVSLVVEVVAV